MPKKITLCLVSFILAGGFTYPMSMPEAQAQTPATNVSPSVREAFRTLEKVDTFAIGGTGFTGQRSPGEVALRSLLKDKNSATLVRGLLKTARPAGKLYALLGLQQTGSKSDVAEVAAGLRKSSENVRTISGCLVGRETVSALATRIEKGDYVLRPDTKPRTGPAPPSGK